MDPIVRPGAAANLQREGTYPVWRWSPICDIPIDPEQRVYEVCGLACSQVHVHHVDRWACVTVLAGVAAMELA